MNNEPMNTATKPELFWTVAIVDDNGTPRIVDAEFMGQGLEVQPGATLCADDDFELSEEWIAASRQILDILPRAHHKKTVLCQVQLGGEITEYDGKHYASECTIVAVLEPENTDSLLRDYARWCALQVSHLWNPQKETLSWLSRSTLSYESYRESARMDAAKAANAAVDTLYRMKSPRYDDARDAVMAVMYAAKATMEAADVTSEAAQVAVYAASKAIYALAHTKASQGDDWKTAKENYTDQFAAELDRRACEAFR